MSWYYHQLVTYNYELPIYPLQTLSFAGLFDSIVKLFIDLKIFSSRETWEKVNLRFNDNGTITFNQRKKFRFDPVRSAGSEDDMVIIPNIPMLVSSFEFIFLHQLAFQNFYFLLAPLLYSYTVPFTSGSQ